MPALELSQVHRVYSGGKQALRGVDLSIAPGEVVGLLGRNGAGKTTLIRIAMGMIHPQRGTVNVFGLDPWKDAVAVKRRVGYVAEEQILPGSLRIDELFALHESLFPTWDDAFARDLADRFALSRRERVRTLSKGKARAAALVCAVAHRPELLILDEPAGGLDPVARRDFLETAVALLNDSAPAILFSTHQMADVERLPGRVALLHEGKVLLDSSLDDVRQGFSLAVLEPDGIDDATIRRLESCRGVRRKRDAIHALFELQPERASALVAERFGRAPADCRSLPLEDLFIELVESER